MTLNPELIKAGAAIAGELVGAIVEAFINGDDIEPLVSALPPEAQKRARRVLERQETKDALTATREEILGPDSGS